MAARHTFELASEFHHVADYDVIDPSEILGEHALDGGGYTLDRAAGRRDDGGVAGHGVSDCGTL
jgi:hypothetical protein